MEELVLTEIELFRAFLKSHLIRFRIKYMEAMYTIASAVSG